MDCKIIENKKDLLEIEFDDKTLPNALLTILLENGVDAYAYDPHPLFSAYRLHVEAPDPVKELKKSVKELEKEWKTLSDLIEDSSKKKK